MAQLVRLGDDRLSKDRPRRSRVKACFGEIADLAVYDAAFLQLKLAASLVEPLPFHWAVIG